MRNKINIRDKAIILAKNNIECLDINNNEHVFTMFNYLSKWNKTFGKEDKVNFNLFEKLNKLN